MERSYNPEAAHRPLPAPSLRGPKGYKLFKNPPQPHMCIQDFIKGTTEKLYINVMSWKQIGNTRQSADLIPLYGGMQIPHGCMPNCNRPPLIVFAVMVNPEILKINGKNAPNPQERDALVNLLCDFVEAMNPGLHLARQPIVLKDRDLAGELKDVWHAVQAHREKEKIRNQEAIMETTHKIYHIDGPSERNDAPLENIPAYDQNINSSSNFNTAHNHNNRHSQPGIISAQDQRMTESSENTINQVCNSVVKPTTSMSLDDEIPPDCTSPKFDKLKTKPCTKESSPIHNPNSNDQSESNGTTEFNHSSDLISSSVNHMSDKGDIPYADEFQNDNVNNKTKDVEERFSKVALNSNKEKNVDSALFKDCIKVTLPSQ